MTEEKLHMYQQGLTQGYSDQELRLLYELMGIREGLEKPSTDTTRWLDGRLLEKVSREVRRRLLDEEARVLVAIGDLQRRIHAPGTLQSQEAALERALTVNRIARDGMGQDPGGQKDE